MKDFQVGGNLLPNVLTLVGHSFASYCCLLGIRIFSVLRLLKAFLLRRNPELNLFQNDMV
jgi:hypothetical protein